MPENSNEHGIDWKMAKECALIAASNEYNRLRHVLLNLYKTSVIESGNVYETILQNLIDEEEKVKQEIQNL